MIFRLPQLTPTRLVLAGAAFLILTGNWTFYEKLTDIYPLSFDNAFFLLSISVFHYCFLLLLSVIFWLLIPARIVVSLLILLAATVGYFADQLNIVIDYEMIRNVVETDIDEASDLLNSGLVMRFFLLGIVPVTLIWSLPYRKAGRLRELRYKLQSAGVAIVLMLLCVLTLGDHYGSFFREHKPVRHYMNPGYAIYSAGKYIDREVFRSRVHEYIALAEQSNITETDRHTELVVLVVGETARADHFSLNGYDRPTNPELSRLNGVISYTDISACGTSTSVSVPCMFGYSGRADYDHEISGYTENILDLLKRAGVNILWRDNNTGSKGVASRITYQDFKSRTVNPVCDSECRDVGMLVGLQEYVDTLQGDILIVLHQMGSHGPAYFKRYPEQFEQFRPACKSIELSQCTTDEVINAYDNSILYTDHFLAQVIAFLQHNTPRYETTMLYVSDHGESLGERGLYLHGMPYLIAPEEQVHVPIIVWSGASSDIDFEKSLVLKDQPNSHDALFGTLLDLFEVDTDLKPPGEHSLVYLEPEGD